MLDEQRREWKELVKNVSQNRSQQEWFSVKGLALWRGLLARFHGSGAPGDFSKSSGFPSLEV